MLETDQLVFRGAFRLSVPLSSICSVVAEAGRLAVRFPEGTAVFEFGGGRTDERGARLAGQWAERIRHPKRRIDKLGVKQGEKVAVLAIDDGFLAEVEEATGRPPLRRPGTSCDAIFLAASSDAALGQLERLRASLKPGGALWVIRPKGSSAISEKSVMEAGRKVGLVDVKVVRFSDTHTAEKFVIPRAQRDHHPSG